MQLPDLSTVQPRETDDAWWIERGRPALRMLSAAFGCIALTVVLAQLGGLAALLVIVAAAVVASSVRLAQARAAAEPVEPLTIDAPITDAEVQAWHAAMGSEL